MDNLELSDIQVHQLNSYEPVQQARTEFLTKASECIRNPTLELKEEVASAYERYSMLFADRLNEVTHNLPQPSSTAELQNDRMKGFKK